MAMTKHVAMDKGTTKQVLSRLDRLEKAVFGDVGEKLPSQKKQNFSGPAGGARLLISRGFFKVKRFIGDVKKALATDGYHYGAAQVQTAMNRLSRRDGPLVASKEGGKKSYVNRK